MDRLELLLEGRVGRQRVELLRPSRRSRSGDGALRCIAVGACVGMAKDVSHQCAQHGRLAPRAAQLAGRIGQRDDVAEVPAVARLRARSRAFER